ncbi:MAG: glycosyltransferase [Pseudomonadota bacterium]
MKIALVSPYTLPFYCGNSVLAERLREGLTSRGHEVTLFNSINNEPAEAVRFSPHLVHSFNAERPYHWMQQLRNQCTVPWVSTLTGTDYHSWSGIKEPPFQIQESLETADALVVFQEEALQVLLSSLPQLRNKMHVIPQGVTPLGKGHDALSVRTKYGIKPDSIVFLMVSGIRPVKNIACAIEAFSEVEHEVPTVILFQVGPIIDREEADRVLELGKKLKCFRYLEVLSPLEVRELMGAADVFLNTSFNEGMAGAVLEAMAEGLPVLASAVAGNRSLVKNGVNGLLFPVEQRQALSQAAVKLARDSSLRKVMGSAGKKIIAQHHSKDKEAERYERLYQKLLQPVQKRK